MTEDLEHVAHEVLRKTAEYLRGHPETLTKYDDTLKPVLMRGSAKVVEKALELAHFEATIDTLLQAHCRIVAGRSHHMVLTRVYELIYKAHRLHKSGWCSVSVYNDTYCTGPADAIVYLEKSFKRSKISLISSNAESLVLHKRGRDAVSEILRVAP